MRVNQNGEVNLYVKSASIDGVELELDQGTTYDIPQRDGSFLSVEFANGGFYGQTLDASAIHASGTLTVTRVDARESWSDCDFDGNGCGKTDIDLLVAGINDTELNLMFDLNGDTAVDSDDLSSWLSQAGYHPGDANLDGLVNTADMTTWQAHVFRSVPKWTFGDFNGDGAIDVSDFNVWNSNRSLAAAPAAVPEPSFTTMLVIGLAVILRRSNS